MYVLRAVLGFQFKRVFPSIKTIYSTCLQGQVRSPSPLSIICHKEPKILIKSKYRIHEMCVIPTIYCSTRPHGPKRRKQKRNMRFGDAKNKNTVRLDCEKAIKRSWGLPLRKNQLLGGSRRERESERGREREVKTRGKLNRNYRERDSEI